MPTRNQFETDADFERALLDWFAGMAMMGFVSREGRNGEDINDREVFWDDDRTLSKWSFDTARAMLAERKKP